MCPVCMDLLLHKNVLFGELASQISIFLQKYVHRNRMHNVNMASFAYNIQFYCNFVHDISDNFIFAKKDK